MAPLNPNRTPRLEVRYTSMGIQHSLLFRFEQGQTPSGAVTAVTTLLNTLADLMRSNDSFTDATFADAGEDFSFPVAFTPIQGNATNVTANTDPQAQFISFVGRDTVQGRRVRYDFYSGSDAIPHPDRNRIYPGDDEQIDAALAAFQANATGADPGASIVTIGGNPPIFNNYVNVAYNAYWQRKQRRTGV